MAVSSQVGCEQCDLQCCEIDWYVTGMNFCPAIEIDCVGESIASSA